MKFLMFIKIPFKTYIDVEYDENFDIEEPSLQAAYSGLSPPSQMPFSNDARARFF